MTSKKGSILPLILTVALFALAFFIVKNKYSVSPNSKTQETAKSIPKYPRVKTWQIVNAKKICLLNLGGCVNQPSRIIFTTQDAWGKIYSYFQATLLEQGWSTNSQVYTSIPASIVFFESSNSASCEANLSQYKDSFLNKNKDPNLNTYIFTVKCTSTT